EHGTITIDGNGQQTRDFIYVRDLCRALLLACSNKVSGEIFQIASGIETAIGELAELVSSALGLAITPQYGPRRQGDIERNYSAIAKARERLAWEPMVPLVDGLRETMQWYEHWLKE